jgi:hypothetical protein
MNRTWNIDLSGNRKVVLDYQVRIEHSWDKILVYSVDNSGAAVLQTTLTGSTSGRIYSLYPNGKMRVVFTSDYSVNCSTNPSYSGFTINVSKVTGISYSYDSSGNRTGRTIVLEKGLIATLRSGTSEEPEEEIVFSEKLPYSSDIENWEADIRIYPNPTEGRFAVKIDNVPAEEIVGEIYLLDMKGRLLEKRNIGSERNFDFDLSREVAGVYILNIHLDKEESTWKIIKK